MKVCILSKGRADTMTTHLLFRPADVLIFVEPQEVRKYKIFNPDYEIVDILKNDMGIIYVRNFIFDYMKDEKIIMADDDITMLGIRNSDGRYDRLTNTDTLLSDCEAALSDSWSYVIPYETFAYFINKQLTNERYVYNVSPLIDFYGINLKHINANNIRYDKDIVEGEYLDVTAQIIIFGGSVCCDYNYCKASESLTPGGLESSRKFDMHNEDALIRQAAEKLAEKYGVEFISSGHSKEDGRLTTASIKFSLLAKRRAIALENYNRYLHHVNNMV